jgi:hypothetical protein
MYDFFKQIKQLPSGINNTRKFTAHYNFDRHFKLHKKTKKGPSIISTDGISMCLTYIVPENNKTPVKKLLSNYEAVIGGDPGVKCLVGGVRYENLQYNKGYL